MRHPTADASCSKSWPVQAQRVGLIGMFGLFGLVGTGLTVAGVEAVAEDGYSSEYGWYIGGGALAILAFGTGIYLLTAQFESTCPLLEEDIARLHGTAR